MKFTAYDILLNEDLVLEAGESYINFTDDSILMQRELRYSWQCQEPFDAYCVGQEEKTLTIPFSVFEELTGSAFYQVYNFTVFVRLVTLRGEDAK